MSASEENVMFGGRVVAKRILAQAFGSGLVVDFTADRLQSKGNGSNYYPYGEPKTATAGDDREGFATYTRDEKSGLDYADQRWYASGVGRFLTSDPYHQSATQSRPASWNLYGYTETDAVNSIDPDGQARCWVDMWVVDNAGTWSSVTCSSIGGSKNLQKQWYLVSDVSQRSEQSALAQAQKDFGQAMDYEEANDHLRDVYRRAYEALDDPGCKRIFGEGLRDPMTGGTLNVQTVLQGLLHGAHGSIDFLYAGDEYLGETSRVGLRFDGSPLKPYYEKVKITINMDLWNPSYGRGGEN